MQKSVIDSFSGKHKFLSNFYPCEIDYENKNYSTVEHAFVAAKSHNWEFKERISKLRYLEAGKAKRLGRKCTLRDDWEDVKISIMKELLEQKFNQRGFKEALLNTGNADLIEGNNWHDNFWGKCYCPRCINKRGENMLGKLLMEIRENLK